MTISKNKILVTCAFPYANGSIHLGHLLEQIQADIWVRFKRMQGHEVWFICADDSHGTAIMLKSQKNKISPEKLILDMLEEHKNDFFSFKISHDYYSSTHTKENFDFLKKIFYLLQKKNLIEKKNILQFYDSEKKIFLPDRLIVGSCPKCFSPNQFGDICEICNHIYNPIELINPISVLSNKKPILRYSEHLFFNVPFFKNMLIKWINSGVISTQVLNKSKEWLDSGLKKWDISRDSPYFGFKIPNFPNKYFYVWFDAPIGYISCFKQLCNARKNIDFNEFWDKNSKSFLYHFIGKDITYFHTLFWPSILEGSEFRKPTEIFVHGYVTIKGSKLSKSKGISILAKNWIKYFDSDSLRYYFASKLSSNIEDIEIDLKEIVNKVNTDLVNKIVNLASRTSKIINCYYNNMLSPKLDDEKLYNFIINSGKKIIVLMNNREYNKSIKIIMSLADIGNKYINDKKPWKKLKIYGSTDEVQSICSMGINIFRILMTYLKPIITVLAEKTENFLNTELKLSTVDIPLLNHKIYYFSPLYPRLKIDLIKKMLLELHF